MPLMCFTFDTHFFPEKNNGVLPYSILLQPVVWTLPHDTFYSFFGAIAFGSFFHEFFLYNCKMLMQLSYLHVKILLFCAIKLISISNNKGLLLLLWLTFKNQDQNLGIHPFPWKLHKDSLHHQLYHMKQ